VIVVDNEESVLRLTSTMLTRLGYHALVTPDAEKALEMTRAEKGWIDVALVDLNLEQGLSGLEVITRILELDDTIVGIIITGDASLPAALGAMRHGAYDFLQKPFSMEHLRTLLERAMKYRNLLRQRLHYRLHMEEMARRRSEALSKLTGQLEQAYQATLETLASVIDARERQTGAHSGRVALITGILARAMNLSGEEVNNTVEGALLHDIGKVAVPDSILLKPGPLTAGEWDVMRLHPVTGYQLLKGNPLLLKVADVVHQHQERYDGSGYPQGLKGEQTCLGARVFALADSYDAIRSNRPYSASRDPQFALAEIIRGRGTLFDPQVVDILIQTQAEIEAVCAWPPPGGP
jgi:putative nucleotidyltransferase with HDIG domain